jgi:hypothetical protein
MENYDSLFEGQNSVQNEPFDKEAWAEQKKQERQQLFETMEEMADKTLSDIGSLEAYLNMQSRLGRMSVGNTLLILSQKPDASYVTDFDGWQEKGRAVTRGQKALLILEAGREYAREDGTMGMGYNARRVFDVSQTYGKELRERLPVPIKSLLRALATDTPVPIKSSEEVSQLVGVAYSTQDKTIYFTPGLGGNMLFALISRELAKAEYTQGDPQFSTFTSACAAYILCQRYGIDMQNCGPVPENIAGLSAQDKRGILGKIREAACGISERIDKNLMAERAQQRSENRER